MVLDWKKMILKKIVPGLYSITGPFIIAYCWNWYHLTGPQRQVELWWLTLLYAGLIFFVFFFFKGLFRFLTVKFKWHTFWVDEFVIYLDELFFLGALSFPVLFSETELFSLIYIFSILIFIFLRLDNILGKHKEDLSWQKVNRMVFLMAGFIFVLTAVFQFIAYTYYLFDSNAKYHNIVLFRSFSLTMFWLGSFSLASLFYFYLKKKKQLFLFFWLVLFSAIIFLDLINTGIVSNSGLYLSPVIFEHFSFMGLKIFAFPIIFSFIVFFLLLFVSSLIFRKVIKAHEETTKRHWLFYNFALLSVAFAAIFSVSSFWNTPQMMTFKNFFEFRLNKEMFLSEEILKKLENFGLSYKIADFYVMRKDQPKEEKLDFKIEKPNIVLIYLESFSARLTGPYNENYKEVTPNLNDFTQHKNTIIFKKVYNASTPTITSLISSLCSFLPPTGHQEIEREKMLKRQYLTCLPEILKSNGYQNTSFVTAVDKEFANKNTILESMGIDKIYGQEELKKRINEPPKSWGYSDQQLFPFIFELMQEKEEPFLLGYATVDTHPPFNLPQDLVPFGDGSGLVLNTFHTTDFAFGDFWRKFKNSSFAKNTILILMADHAIFPAALEKKHFPDFGGQTTFYDELFFGVYLPENTLPKENEVYGSGIDLAPTILHLLDLPVPESFEGYSLLGSRKKYPNLIGMHEFGLYLNQELTDKSRQESFAMPTDVDCEEISSNKLLNLCELKKYYDWKREMLLSGRLW